jgi:hypothetical protein
MAVSRASPPDRPFSFKRGGFDLYIDVRGLSLMLVKHVHSRMPLRFTALLCLKRCRACVQ